MRQFRGGTKPKTPISAYEQIRRTTLQVRRSLKVLVSSLFF